MKQKSIPLGTIAGIPIGIDYSWFFIIAFLTWTLATSYFPHLYRDWSAVEYWMSGFFSALALFASVLLHELGHSWTAKHFKIKVQEIQLHLFGGLSRIEKEPDTAQAALLIPLVGPLVSLFLAGLFFLVSFWVKDAELPFALCQYLVSMNLILGLFNLVPGYPLDGGKVLMATLWFFSKNRRNAVLVSASFGGFFAYVFIAAGGYLLINGNLVTGLWVAFIGWILLNASGKQIKTERLKEAVNGHTVAEAMGKNYLLIESETKLATLFEEKLLSAEHRLMVVEKGSEAIGFLDQNLIEKFPQEKRSEITVEELMLPFSYLPKLQEDADLWSAIEVFEQNKINGLPVMQGDHFQGILTRGDIAIFLRKSQSRLNRLLGRP
jgi:Zn-dependent protease/CBS domain-containing protein